LPVKRAIRKIGVYKKIRITFSFNGKCSLRLKVLYVDGKTGAIAA
jgi:hypothetical protein